MVYAVDLVYTAADMWTRGDEEAEGAERDEVDAGDEGMRGMMGMRGMREMMEMRGMRGMSIPHICRFFYMVKIFGK